MTPLAALVTDPSSGELVQIKTDAISGDLLLAKVPVPRTECLPMDGRFAIQGPTLGPAAWTQSPETSVSAVALPSSGADPASGLRTLIDDPLPLGEQYDLSLIDALVLFVCDKEVTGSDTVANLSSITSQRLAMVADTASIYEYQLGIRLLLQELILIPNTGSYTAVTATVDSATNSLDTFKSWLATHRLQPSYQWSMAALWDDFSSGSTVGLATVGSVAEPSSASTNDLGSAWNVLGHEMGHNLKANHTASGTGIMAAGTPGKDGEPRSFFVLQQASTDTSAEHIHQYSAARLTGSVAMRDPEAMPFANDDVATTPADTPVLISVLINDDLATVGGQANGSLTLVETGTVTPIGAGTAVISGNQIQFTPSSGFVGTAWFSYTIRGDLGNGGLGWLHRGDVAVEVGLTSPTTFDVTIAPGARLDLHLPPGRSEVQIKTIGSSLSVGSYSGGALDADDAIYFIDALAGASGSSSFTYDKDGITYTMNVTFANTDSWNLDILKGGSKVLFLPPGLFAVDSMTQASDALIDEVLNPTEYFSNLDTATYIVRPKTSANGSDSFTYVKGGVTYTVNLNYLNEPVDAQDDGLITSFNGTLNAYRFNPLINDIGVGYLRPVQVNPLSGPSVSSGVNYFPNALVLTSATLADPSKGTLTFETRRMTVNGVSADLPTNHLIFEPALGSSGIAVVNYTVTDAAGNAVAATSDILLPLATIDSPLSEKTLITPGQGLLVEASLHPMTTAPFTGSVSATWSVAPVSGTGATTATISDPSATRTKITFATAGSYHLVLTSSDGGHTTVNRRLLVVSATDIANTNLTLLWRLDEALGTSAVDGSPAGNNGVVAGSPTFQASGGQTNGALQFTGSNQNVSVSTANVFPSDALFNDYVVSLWFNVADKANPTEQLLWEAGSSGAGMSIYLDGGALKMGAFYSTVGEFISSSNTAVQSGVWHHVVFQMADFQLTGYLDGSVFGSVSLTSLGASTNFSGLGAVQTSTSIEGVGGAPVARGHLTMGFIGSIDTVAVYIGQITSEALDEIIAVPPNRAPVLTLAPTSLTIANAHTAANIGGSSTDDGLPVSPGAVTHGWEVGSALGDVVFNDPSSVTTSVMFAAAGSQSLCLTAADGHATSFLTLPVTVQSPGTDYFGQWLANHPTLTGGDQSITADPDDDDLKNLLEFAFGGTPTVFQSLLAGAALTPTQEIVTDGGTDYLEITYRQQRDSSGTEGVGRLGYDYTIHGVRYSVQYINDLVSGTWESDPAKVLQVGSAVDHGDGTESVTVRVLQPYSVRQFGRVNVQVFE